MKKAPTSTLPNRIGPEEAQNLVMRGLRVQALVKLEFYRSKMKPFETKYATAFSRFQQRVKKAPREDYTAWDDLIEWEAYYWGYQEWKNATLSCGNGQTHSRILTLLTAALRPKEADPTGKATCRVKQEGRIWVELHRILKKSSLRWTMTLRWFLLQSASPKGAQTC
jgi:hypothetical protein